MLGERQQLPFGLTFLGFTAILASDGGEAVRPAIGERVRKRKLENVNGLAESATPANAHY